jgi:hypothetical protein
MVHFVESEIFSTETDTVIGVEVTKEADLVDGWWTSDQLYGLERRAFFSKVSYSPSFLNRTNNYRNGFVLLIAAALQGLETTSLSSWPVSRSLSSLAKTKLFEHSTTSVGIEHIPLLRRQLVPRLYWAAGIMVGLMIREGTS